MSFIAPLFFLALAGLAIPVLIHLIQREKKQIMRFPSLMFVQRVPYKSIQRRRIHNWLLLMVRLTALALIILAFARPFFDQEELPTAGTGAREVVVLLDQSYSIGYGDRWERARAAAYDAINGLGASDRGSVVLFSSGAEIALRSTAAGERDSEGNYPEGSVNDRVQKKLNHFIDLQRQFAGAGEKTSSVRSESES